MSDLVDIMQQPLLALFGPSIRGRRIEGEHMTLAMIELDANTSAPEHQHVSEQLGMVLAGEAIVTVEDETRTLGPGGTWRILSDRPHSVTAGPNGAVVVNAFTPVRSDWDDLPVIDEAGQGQPRGT